MKARYLILLAGLWSISMSAEGADWPQWQGPKRTNISEETGLLMDWPKDGPKLLWTFDNAGVGYSGPAIVGDKLYTMGDRSGKQTIYCLDTKTGKQLWSLDVAGEYKNGYGGGPRCTPTVDGDSIFGICPAGDLFCCTTGGKLVWKKNLKSDFGGAQMGGWGYSESPLVDGDRVICAPGGNKGTIVALDKKTGKQIWQSGDVKDNASYSSIIAADQGKGRQYIYETAKGVVGLDAKTGKQLWYFPRGDFKTAVCPTAIFSDGQVFNTAGYGAKSIVIKVEGAKPEEVWSNANMENHHGGVVLIDGHLYGCRGHGGQTWACVDFKTGDKKWDERKVGGGSLTAVGNRLYLYSQDKGTCVLLEATPKAWTEHGRFTIPKESKLPRGSGRIWTHPVVSNGKLFLRDLDLIFCYDVKGATADAGKTLEKLAAAE